MVGEFYVMVPNGQASSFTSTLASLLEKYEMTSKLGKSTDDKGNSVFVLDADGPGVRLRSENVLLSGHESAEMCGVYTEPHSDPGQYFISISTDATTAEMREGREMLARIAKDLKVSGFDVRWKPETCSPESKKKGIQ